MATYSIGTSNTGIEVGNTYGGRVVKATPKEAMFLNLNNEPVRKAVFNGTIDSDASVANPEFGALNLRKTILSSDLATGNELRNGEIINVMTTGASFKGQARVVSCSIGTAVIDLLASITVIATDTYSANADDLLSANVPENINTETSPNLSFATVSGSPVANNLTIIAVDKNGSLVRG